MDPEPKKTALLNAAVLHRMSDLAGQGILLTDTELVIIAWNRWLESHTGLKADAVIGRSLLDVYPGLVEKGLQRQYQWALEGQVRVLSQGLHGYLLAMEPAAEGTGFSQMQQSARVSPLTENGQVVGTVTVIDDVTERVAREAELQAQIEFRSRALAREQEAREEAERANRVKDDFLATISHELRTPLNAIIGWSQMLLGGKLDQDTSQRAIETIHRNAQSQNKLIGDLLDVSRIISGKLALDRRPLDLPVIIAASLDAIRPAAEAKNISLHSEIGEHAEAILADANRLQQVIWNLLTNAIKFTPRGGRVKVVLRRVEDHVQMIFIDSGIGISPEFLPLVFDRFRQADAASTRQQGGLGLGLSIVRHIVESHGGTVSAESAGEGKGSKFIVSLPLIDIENMPVEGSGIRAHREESMSTSLKGLNILVVDDEADSCDLLRALLERCGSKVATVTSAAEALEIIKETPPDLLISDIGMPIEDGYSLIAKVRALPAEQGGQIPAVALTAYAAPTDGQRIIQSGYQIHLAKPIETDEFLSAIANLAARKASFVI